MSYNYESNPPIGIDFGTSNSAIASFVNTKRIHGSQVYCLNSYGNEDDSNLLASSIYLKEHLEGNEILVGVAAENNWVNDPTGYVGAIKRKIGEIDKIFTLGEERYSALDLSSEVINTLLKAVIEQNYNFSPSGIVITVPYYYKQPQNNNTLLALEKALNFTFRDVPENKRPKVLGLVPEPIAASLYYINYLDTGTIVNARNAIVFDLGGGTLDITLFKIMINTQKLHFEVLSSDGQAKFGGEDFDNVLMEYVVNEEEINFDNLTDKIRRREKKMIKDAVKDAKERLSFNKEVHLSVGNLFGNEPIDTTIKKATFDQILSGNNVLQRNFGKELLDAISRSLIKSNIKKEDIDLILLIGGSSQIPYFQNLLKNTFKNAQLEVKQDFLKYAVVKGAALYAAYLLDKDHGHNHMALGKGISYEDSKIIFRTPHALGIEKQKGQFSVIIPANIPVPTKSSKVFIPTTYADASKKTIKLDNIRICQGNTEDVQSLTSLGFVEKLPIIYTHGRPLEDIKIKIDFEATVTNLTAHILIPKSNKHEEDISLHTHISTVNS